MKRMPVHVAVENLGDNILFYSAEPTVHKPAYCTWKLTDPALNFVISQRGATGEKPGEESNEQH